ncbi:MAG TPA: sigma-70 family RNA polymerase sigma factor [Kribbellaceae bacterium]|jgi:RNA polymerase sigma factor (sigma-70 family)
MFANSTAAAEPADPADLLARAAGGEHAAWAELIRRYAPLLWSRVRQHRLQQADGLDVVQTAWLRLAENIDRIHSPEHLASWLTTVVSRECLRTHRMGSRAVPADDADLAAVEPAAGPEPAVLEAAEHAALRSAVAGLPPKRRALMAALFDDDRRSYAQIASELGMPVGSIGPTRARTLADLARIMRELGYAA